MNTGKQAIAWLYHEQLKVDDKWAMPVPNGFKWWPDKHLQSIEIIGEAPGPGGEIGHLVSVETEFLHEVELSDRNLAAINALLMSFPSMAGPVYNARTRSLNLFSLVLLHPHINHWMNPLISMAAVLQIAEARMLAHEIATTLGAKETISGHPEQGLRPRLDDMAELVENLVAPLGQHLCKWSEGEFLDIVEQYVKQSSALGGCAGRLGCTVEYSYGGDSSLCQITGDQAHPKYGNGLMIRQSFPVRSMSDIEGIKLALSLNTRELAVKPLGYGFGSYAYQDGAIHFTCFLPNAAHRAGLLRNLYFASSQRARKMSPGLKNQIWKEKSSGQRHGESISEFAAW